jgi:phytoene synthase
MASDLARAYRACARTTRRNARNFYFAFLSLPAAQRRAVYALYAFCHESDEIADSLPAAKAAGRGENSSAVLSVDESQGALSGTGSKHSDDLERRRGGLAAMRERLANAARGEPTTDRDRALADAIDRFGVREADLADVLTGVEMDLEPVRIETYDELRTYCYHVASAVGLATLPILSAGAAPTDTMREKAIDLGLGMQYVNVLRDVDEDLGLGRVYLPLEALAAHGADEATLRGRTMTDGLHAVVADHAARARALLERGRQLLADLPRAGRACPWLLSEIYGRILARILHADDPLFSGRTSLPTTEKLGLLLSAPWRRL